MKLILSLAIASFALTVHANDTYEKSPQVTGEKVEHGEHPDKDEHRDNAALFPQPKPDLTRGTAPRPPELNSPAFQAKVSGDNAALQWKESAGADSYHVQVATDPAFKWLIADDHWVKGTTFEVKGLEKGKQYFWRVAGWKSDNMKGANKSFFSMSTFETQ